MIKKQSILDSCVQIVQRMKAAVGVIYSILRDAIQRFTVTLAAEAAASMSYYAFFSLFPFLLFLVAIGSNILQQDQVYTQVVRLISDVFPNSQELIEVNVQQVLRLRGSFGLIGLVGLLWSSTAFFTILARNVNRAWPQARVRNFVQDRLLALRMIGALASMLILSLLFNAVINLFPTTLAFLFQVTSLEEIPNWAQFTRLGQWLITFLMYLSVYRWIPATKVSYKGAMIGAAVATMGWQGASFLFGWFLQNGWARYELVYGSLGAVAALMFWVYLISLISLFGAHLHAAVDRYALQKMEDPNRRYATSE